jgi:hypothetical protein
MGGHRTNQVFFDNVRVSSGSLVGEINRGWTYICEALDFERFTLYTVSPLLRKFDAVLDLLKTQQSHGKLLSADQAHRRTAAQFAVEIETAKMLQRRVIDAASKGRVPAIEAAMFKVFSTRLSQEVTRFALGLLGPRGLLRRDAPDAVADGMWEHFYQTTPLDTIGGGTSEVQKNIIARRGLGLPVN